MVDSSSSTVPGVKVVQDVAALPLDNWLRPDAYTDLVASDSPAANPIVCGVWTVGEEENGQRIHHAEYDEMKYVIAGESVWEDANSGERFHANAGSMVWLPKGSRTKLVRSKNLSTIYVGSTYRKPSDPAQLRSSWLSKLDSLYESLIQLYAEGNAKSKVRHKAALEYLPGGNTRSVLYYEPFPLAFASGQGCHLISLDGKEYLDFVSEFSAAFFGHSHPVILAAVEETINQGFNLGGPNENEVELARQLVNRFKSIEKIRFTNSGTEANAMALQVAINFTGRKKVMVFQNSYHGAFMSFGAAKNVMNLPYDYVIGKYNDVHYTEPLISEEIAAIILEPMQGAGGMLPADKDFLQFLREAATRTGAVLIFDEIITSRLHIGGLQAHHDIYPDMTTVAKYLGGGFGFGAFGGKADIMAVLDPNRSFHSGTYNNNTFTMAAGVAAGKMLTAEKIGKANALGDRVRDGINNLVWRHQSTIIRATGFGSTIGVHFGGPSPTRLKDAFFFYLIKNGIYIGKRGFMSINLMHKDEHVDHLLRVVENFLQEILG